MNRDLKEIIRTSSLIVHEGSFIYAKVKTVPVTGKPFLISQDDDEITVVTKKQQISELDLIKSNDTVRSLLEIKFSADSPDAVGFLAAVSTALAEEGISISVVSTFSKDYLIVSNQDKEKAVEKLKNIGFSTIIRKF